MTEIIHSPFGQEHPYEQLPEERFPRQPLAGQPFIIGIVTRPPNTVQKLTVRTQVNGVDQSTIEAHLLPNWRQEAETGVGAEFLERIIRVEQDVWQAHLTAPAVGETLTYTIHADDFPPQTFTLLGEDWHSGGGFQFDGQTMTIAPTLKSSPMLPADLPKLIAIAWLTDGQRTRRVRLTFGCNSNEQFYGLGERFNALNQRGNVLDVRCYEQYKNQGKRTYMPIPFLLSSAGFGLYVHSSRWMQFDLAASTPDQWTLEADLGADESLKLTWFADSDPIRIIAQFAQQTGPVVLPPLWSFGLWMSANEWNSQARVMEEAQASLDNAIIPSVLVIEAWSDETTFYIWNDAQYTPKPGESAFQYNDFSFPSDSKWPDPKGMTDWLHNHDIKLILWQIPALKILEKAHPQHENDHAHFVQHGLGVHDPDGSLHRIKPFWFRGGYLWDVTNVESREWWLNKRAYLLDEVGVDGFKTDGGEHLWGAETHFADGRKGDELWNEYPQRYTEAYYNFATQRREAVTFSRAGFTGSQRSPLHWAGDENSTWEAFRHSILAGLSANISGIPFWGWDIGGFSGPIPDAELYLRATAMAAFCPVMQYHSEYNPNRQPKMDRTPWNIQARTGDQRVVPIFRHLVNVRHNLMPYIWREAQHSAQTGEPMMRALKLTDDQASDYQYLFGRDLLISPVVEPGIANASVYLPAGDWFDLWTRTHYTGGRSIEIRMPLDSIPVFVRGGASLPLNLGASGSLGEYVPLDSHANTEWTF